MRLSLFLVLVVFTTALHAQDREKDALRRMQAANQRLAAERAQLEREKAKLEQEQQAAAKEKSALEKSLKGEKGLAAKQKKEIEALEEAKAGLEAKLAESAAREAALAAKLAETEKALAASRQDGEQLKKRLANQSETIGLWQAKTGACQEKNGELARLGYELAERYRAKTCEDINFENEPFTGIRRARMESLLEDYRQRVDGQHFDARNDLPKEKGQ